jgi:tripartite-type tricarboxylate transporter receptor subunit TctC
MKTSNMGGLTMAISDAFNRLMSGTVLGLAACLSAVALAALPAAAADFYQGKTITIIVGTAPGGGYDTYARTIARHWAKHIPGKPDFVVQNMPGAGSANATEHVYKIAPKDGTTLGAVFPGAIVGPLLDAKVAGRYDPTKIAYIGSADNSTRLCATFKTSKIATIDDARKTEATLGATQAGGSTRDYAYMMNALAGTKFKVVTGYQGSADVALAIERGEVDGLCGYDWTSMKATQADWLKEKKVNLLVHFAMQADPELDKMGVPLVWKFVEGENKEVAELIVAQQVFGRPYIAPPEIPAERLDILRKSFTATMNDKDFLADAEKVKLAVEPVGGDAVQKLVQKLYAAKPAVVERAKQAVVPPK